MRKMKRKRRRRAGNGSGGGGARRGGAWGGGEKEEEEEEEFRLQNPSGENQTPFSLFSDSLLIFVVYTDNLCVFTSGCSDNLIWIIVSCVYTVSISEV